MGHPRNFVVSTVDVARFRLHLRATNDAPALDPAARRKHPDASGAQRKTLVDVDSGGGIGISARVPEEGDEDGRLRQRVTVSRSVPRRLSRPAREGMDDCKAVQRDLGLEVVASVYSRPDTGSGPLMDVRKIVAKLSRRGESSPQAFLQLGDVIGLTVVVQYPDQREIFFDALRRKLPTRTKMGEVEKHENKNGYFAHHTICSRRYGETLRCEIQVKTLLHDAWSKKMHDLTYKPGGKLDARLKAMMIANATTIETVEQQSQSPGRVLLSHALLTYTLLGWGMSGDDIANAFGPGGDRRGRESVLYATRLFEEPLQKERFRSWARPFGGGTAVQLEAHHWEIDDFTPRFATSALNLHRSFDTAATPTHWIFVDEEVIEALHEQHREPGVTYRHPRTSEPIRSLERPASAEASEAATAHEAFLRLPEVERLVGMKKSTIYARIEQGRFPAPVRNGARISSWRREEITDWLRDPR